MNNFLSTLKPIAVSKKKRIGRGLGSGRGAKSGRGTTRHQKARESIPLSFEGGQGRMVKRFPLLRGKSRNKSIKRHALAISLKLLNQFKDNDVVDAKALFDKKIVNKKYYSIKILANGKLERKLTVKLPVSLSVKKIVEGLGGKVEEV